MILQVHNTPFLTLIMPQESANFLISIPMRFLDNVSFCGSAPKYALAMPSVPVRSKRYIILYEYTP